MTKRRDNPQR